ncbi:hypothetical protein NZD89_16250 [Alicyclobacillus fastidiosus]|uniref:Uncharacterized protein n=1 Tax=Alicyclobacillus fastidiosus TaxID=392011 RepID=A0ABY6ZBN3_9BACL|nr:hypothetical protein [Alicyclobacillus fastidiosus]WAH39948.1 hypothetical protein NZD89_16250 [Alicyclobacillus fastidiosus]GMA61228.1 hypothetical protein GCM10025859_16680 [Alicyclobacillus fastidiosus]
MLPPPLDFDANEWFIILNIVLGYTLVLLLPRRYPRVVSILVVLFCVSIAIILDHSIATPPLDMYDINDQKKYELMDVITYLMYSPFAILSVYLFDKFNPRGLYFTAYVIAWSGFATLFEWLATLCRVFTYTEWHLLYSFSVYLVATVSEIGFFRLILRHFNKTRKTEMPTANQQ